jgi:hypothetical protein
MDQSVLVNEGKLLVGWLDATKIKPKAAVWVYNSEAESWKLWIVPSNDISKTDFYLALSQIISEHRAELPGFDISEVEFKSAGHPAIKGLGAMIRMEGIGSAHMSSNRLNGFLLPDGIVLRMAI